MSLSAFAGNDAVVLKIVNSKKLQNLKLAMLNTIKKVITHSNPCPYKNIALEEILFKQTISTREPCLRLWHNKNPVIYLGIGKNAKDDVYLERCEQDNIPVIRRFSGGGTVLHCAGVLNYTYILPLEKHPEFRNIKQSYTNFATFIWNKKIHSVQINASDFCIDNKKFCGNAQARRRNTLLHHGSILVDPDFTLITKYLKTPKEQPKYRNNRSHNNFLISLKQIDNFFSYESLINLFLQGHKNSEIVEITQEELRQAELLVEKKYKTEKWNRIKYRLTP